MGLLKEATVPAWTQWGTAQGFILQSYKTGPVLLPCMQSDPVIKAVCRERCEADTRATPWSGCSLHVDIPSVSVTEPAPGGPKADSPSMVPPAIQRHF